MNSEIKKHDKLESSHDHVDINPDILKERNNATFDCDKLTNFLDGGKDITHRRREVVNAYFSDKRVIDQFERYQRTYEENYAFAVKNSMFLRNYALEMGYGQEEMNWIGVAVRFDFALGVHFIMFVPTIERLGTDEQIEKWLPPALSLEMIGTYAQTELGHGTNLRGLESMAVYDSAADEFVLSTPMPSGMKWWPGTLGKTANHAILLAGLKIEGQNCGMQAFLVPIRDMDTHEPLPGVQVGDIGPRMSSMSSDNGYLILNNVRIPRGNMLMKNAEVTREGKFVQKRSKTANYSPMVFVRANVVGWSGLFAGCSVTIATRYSAVRRQSRINPSAREVQVLDFQTQQMKLFPSIALAYCLYFAKKYMFESYDRIYKDELSRGIYDKGMLELHAQSCGLKALCTDLATEAAETCRRACGGHGYLRASGIADLCLDAVSSVTYEGENTVLYQQVARHLLKCFSKSISGSRLEGPFAYLSSNPGILPIQQESHFADLDRLIKVLQISAYFFTSRVVERMQSAVESGVPQYEAWNDLCTELCLAARLHVDYFLVENMNYLIHQSDLEGGERQVLSVLGLLHATHRIIVNAGVHIESRAIASEQLDGLRRQEYSLFKQIRPNAVALVDAFDYHDSTLISAIGSYDGNAYKRLYELALKSPLNKSQVHWSFYEHIQPIQKVLKSNL